MSWNLSIGPVHRHRFADAARRVVEALGGAEREQADQAVRAAQAVVDSGVAGDGGVRVVLAGHTNPGHVGLVDGGSADPHVTIAVAHIPLDSLPADERADKPGTVEAAADSPIPGTVETMAGPPGPGVQLNDDAEPLNPAHAANTSATPGAGKPGA